MTTSLHSSGWYVEIDHANGPTITPSVLEGAEFIPTLNGLPRVRIPVRRDDRWNSANFEDQPMRVWYNGERLPIETFVEATHSPERTVLIGRGGEELTQNIQHEYDQKEVHTTVEDLLTNETSYVANVDAPPNTIAENQLQEVDTDVGFRQWLRADLDTLPVETANSTLRLQQSAYVGEAEGGSYSGQYSQLSGGNASSTGTDYGEAIALQSRGEYVQRSFETVYTMPAADVIARMRIGNPDGIDDGHPIDLYLDGEKVGGTAGGFSLLGDWSWLGSQSPSGDLEPGTHTVRVEVNSETDKDGNFLKEMGTDDVFVDLLAIADDRYSYTWDNQVDNDYNLSGPEPLPSGVQLETKDVPSAFQVLEGCLESAWNDTSGAQSVAISNDGGDTWHSASNTTSISATFSSTSLRMRARFTLDRFGSGGSTTPTDGRQSQELDRYDLFATVDDTPLFINKPFNTSLQSILNEAATFTRSQWELVWDDSNDGIAIEWTRRQQRTASEKTGNVTGYGLKKSTAKRAKEVVIYGGTLPVRDEAVIADHGTWVDLAQENLTAGSTTVRNAADGTTYQRDQDFEVRRMDGTIKTLAAGSIPDGADLLVNYRQQVVGEASTDDYVKGDDQVRVETISSLLTERTCEQAAHYLLDWARKPTWSGTVDVAPGSPTEVQPLVEAREFREVPTGGVTLTPRDATQTARGMQVSLGRSAFSDVLEQLRSQTEAITKRI